MPIQHQPFVIGRASKSSTPDLDLKAEGVSRTHSIISMKEGRFFVADQQSRNGTFVNGERLQEGEQRELRSSDRVRFDKQIEYEFLVAYPAPRDPEETNQHRILTPRDTAQLDPQVASQSAVQEAQRRRPRLPANLTATLEVLDAPNEDVGKVYALQYVETRVGSAKEVTNDVQLSGRGISRSHIRLICEISEGHPLFYIVDDNSTNGTRLTRRNDINERPLVPRRREALQEGIEYVILLGERTRLSFYYRGEAATTSDSSTSSSDKKDQGNRDHEGEE
ncbi:MAG: FHA domain-containing protein [Anaerolineae bacterium]